MTDTEMLDWLDKHCDGADHSGYGSDDMWWRLIYNDGNRAEGATIREAINAVQLVPLPSMTQYEVAKEYVDKQLAVMAKYGSAPKKLTKARYERVIAAVLKALPPAEKEKV